MKNDREKRAQAGTDDTSALRRECNHAPVATGVTGLDEILQGGLPRNFMYLLLGLPGAGKTTLGLQFLLEGVRRGERCLHVSFSESNHELTAMARSHHWSFEGIDMLDMNAAMRACSRPPSTVFVPSELELDAVTKVLLEEIQKHRPARLVIDSVAELRMLNETPLRFRRQIAALKQVMIDLQCTVLLLDELTPENITWQPHSQVHGIFELQRLSPAYGSSRRRLNIIKLRSLGIQEGCHDMAIATEGIQVFPRLVSQEHHTGLRPEPISSGIAELDGLLGGGLDRGTTTLIMGPAGVGKSTLSMLFVRQAAQRGEKAKVFLFDETRELYLHRARALNLSLDDYVESEQVGVLQLDPAELSPGQFAHSITEDVKRGLKVVVIDSLNGYHSAMPNDLHLELHLHELAVFLNQQGVLSIFILNQQGVVISEQIPFHLTYLADSVITVRYFEARGLVKKAIAIIKKRSGSHEQSLREFRVQSGTGIQLGPPLTELRGVLTGVPTYEGRMAQMMNETKSKE